MTHFAHGWDHELIPLLQADGIAQVRDEIYWAEIEKERDVFEFPERICEYMRLLGEAGINPLIPLTFANPLYDDGMTPYSDAAIAAYSRYALAVLDKFEGQIHAVEIWNEYNGSFCTGPSAQDRVESYGRLLEAAAAAIRSRHPAVTIVGGVTAGIPYPYLEKLFATGALEHMDAVSVHPYRYNDVPEGIEEEIQRLDALVRRYNHGGSKPLWVTEIGWATREAAAPGDLEITTHDQANFLVRSFALLRSVGVDQVYWYLLRDYAPFATMGLRTDGPAYAVKPALTAFREVNRRLAGARFIRHEVSRKSVYSLLFSDCMGEFRFVWSLEPFVLQLGDDAIVFDLTGRLLEGQSLTVAGAPVYVRGMIGLLPEPEVGAPILADARNGFSNVQGTNGWRYGTFRDGGIFEELPIHRVTDWKREWAGPDWLSISETDQHPSVAGERPIDAVRRWTSDRDASVRVAGGFRCGTEGDGVVARVLVDGSERFQARMGNPASIRTRFEFPAEIRVGTTIDFVVGPGPDLDQAFDSTRVEATIRHVSER